MKGVLGIGKNKKEKFFTRNWKEKLSRSLCGPASGLLVHGTGALAATAVLPGNYGPASGLLARGAGALAATASVGLLLGSWRRSLGGCALFPR